MKKIIGCVLISVFSFNSFSLAQTKIEKFCQVIIEPRNGFTVKTKAVISFGESDSLFLFKDSLVLVQLRKVNELKTSTDVLNYMSSIGWTLVSVIPFGTSTAMEHFYFKRAFDISNVITSNP